MTRQIDTYAIAERLLSLRNQRGLSAFDASVVCGVQESVLRRAEKGSFSIVNLQKIATGYGESLDALLIFQSEVTPRIYGVTLEPR